MSVSITETELLEALATSQHPGVEGARTVREIAGETGLSIGMIRTALQTLQAQGRLSVYRVYRPGICGVMRAMPAYTISPKKKK